jgi:CBS domain containing-hemolysin-like protein
MNTEPSQSTRAAVAATADATAAPGLLSSVTHALRLLLGLRANGSARTEIEHVLASDEAGDAAFSPEERAMLRAILKLGDLRVDDVMVPRADIDAVDIRTPIAEVLARFRESGHSRMPVFRETLDDPLGFVHIKDVMAWVFERSGHKADGPDLAHVDLGQSLKEAGLVRPLLFVPPSMPARVLLEQMQASRKQIALVIDEYGGTDGLVCLEDLVEIIVGEIEDEHDLDEEADIVKVADGQYIADARADLEQVRAVIGPAFEVGAKEDVDTIGGLVFTVTGRIPVRGEIVHAVDGFEFEILDADPGARRIGEFAVQDCRLGEQIGRGPLLGRRRRQRPRRPDRGAGMDELTASTQCGRHRPRRTAGSACPRDRRSQPLEVFRRGQPG